MINPEPVFFSLVLGILGLIVLFIGIYVWNFRHTEVS
jgi:hypothetical protein